MNLEEALAEIARLQARVVEAKTIMRELSCERDGELTPGEEAFGSKGGSIKRTRSQTTR